MIPRMQLVGLGYSRMIGPIRPAPLRTAFRAQYSQLPVVVSFSARSKSTGVNPASYPANQDTKEQQPLAIYEGPFAQTAKRLKLFSVSSLAATIALCPFIFLLDAGISTGMRGGLAVAAVATSGSSTVLVQWCLGSYVRKLTVPSTSTKDGQATTLPTDITITPSTPVSFETLSFLGGRRITTLKVGDLELSSAPFSTIRIRSGQHSMVQDGKGKILSDGNSTKKRFYLHTELTTEEPLRSIMAIVQQNQGSVDTASSSNLASTGTTKDANGAQATGGSKKVDTVGMSERIEQMKRKVAEDANRG